MRIVEKTNDYTHKARTDTGIKYLKYICYLLMPFFLMITSTGCMSYRYHQQKNLYLTAKRNYAQQHYQLALQQLLPFAARGDAEAQYAVGYIYFYGLGGVPRNVDLAKGWMKYAAAKNYTPAVKALTLLDYTNFN